EANYGARAIDHAESLLDDVRNEQYTEPGDNRLVFFGRWRRHKQLAAHELVLVAVIGQAVDLVERPLLRLRRHVHAVSLLAGTSVRMRRAYARCARRPAPKGFTSARNAASHRT